MHRLRVTRKAELILFKIAHSEPVPLSLASCQRSPCNTTGTRWQASRGRPTDLILLRARALCDVRPDAAAAVVAAGGRLLSLSIEEPSLEAIYTRYFENAASQEGERHAP